MRCRILPHIRSIGWFKEYSALLWTVKLYAFRALYSLTENKMTLKLYNLKA